MKSNNIKQIQQYIIENLVDENIEKDKVIDNLEQYCELLQKWQTKINLTKFQDLEELWQRHILDSAQLNKYLMGKQKIYDLGAGAGFPGIILSIIGNYKISLVEADMRKCAFLNYVKVILNLDIEIQNSRIEDTDVAAAEILTARALASVTDILHLLCRKNNISKIELLLLKGQNIDTEILEAIKYFAFEMVKYPSITNDGAAVIHIFNIIPRNNSIKIEIKK